MPCDISQGTYCLVDMLMMSIVAMLYHMHDSGGRSQQHMQGGTSPHHRK